jgi:putative FmdB family regulatory protein
MPIYEYRCQACGQVSEFLVKTVSGGSGNEAQSCPYCGSEDLEKLLSVPSLLRENTAAPGRTCCGRTERCETPPCSTGDSCHRV